MAVHVLPLHASNPYHCPEVSAVSNYGGVFTQLSPFVLGPCRTYLPSTFSQNFENLWQYSKVYKEYMEQDGFPTADWFIWRAKGWADKQAHRYLMGKGRKPEYSWWNLEKLDYVPARKIIYASGYAVHVMETSSFRLLRRLYDIHGEIVLRDYDAYDHIKIGMSLIDVINNPDRIMGHAFVLAMILENCLDECLVV